MVFEDYAKGIHKSKGGLIRSFVKVKDGVITEIVLSGDFFLFPESAIEQLVKSLTGTGATEEAVRAAVQQVYESEGIQSPGTTPEDFARSIMNALEV